MNDLKFALRQLRKSPGFTAIAVITLALGIGLNTTIFSLINDLFLRGLPFREPTGLLHVFSKVKDQRVEFPLSAPRFYHFRDGQTIFDGFAGENGVAATVTGLGDAFQVPIFKATANWFDVLGVRAIRGRTFLRAVGRLKPGVMKEQSFAALQLLENSYRAQYPEKIDAKAATVVKTLPEDVTENLRPGFATLLAAVTFVLVIACSNVANLLLVRFSGRRREIALRLAIGGSRTNIVRLFVLEGLLVSLLAGILGVVLAWQFVPLVPKVAANFLPIEPGSATAISVPVLAFTIFLSLVTGLAMGFYPALQSSRTDIVDALKEGGRGTAGSVPQQRFRKLLVGAQVALSVTLLAGASLLIASFLRLSQEDPGFKYDKLWNAFTVMPAAQYPDQPTRTRFAEQLLNALRATPGLQEAMISSGFPLAGGAGATLY